jgi:Fur family ferric uptake transcriptional regulator
LSGATDPTSAVALAQFRDWLRDHGQPATAQRLAIAGVLLAAPHPLAAEDVIARLDARGTQVGTATVYRTIDVLVESGLVAVHDRGEGFRRFSPVRAATSAGGLLCTSCGAGEPMDDLESERIASIAARAAGAHGYSHERHRLVVYGLCADCRRAATHNAGAG